MSATTKILGPYQPRSTGIGNVAPVRVTSGGTDHVSAAAGAGPAAHQQVQQARNPNSAPYAPGRRPVMPTGAMGNGEVYTGPQGQKVQLIPRAPIVTPGTGAGAVPMGTDRPAVEILEGPAFRASAQRQTSFTVDEVLLIGELLIAYGEGQRTAGADDSVARCAYEKLSEIAPAPDQHIPPAPRQAPVPAQANTLRARVQEHTRGYAETLATPPGARVVDLDADSTTGAPQG